MRRVKVTASFLFAALVICLGLFNTGAAYAQTANNNIVYACYQKENGQLRKVSGPNQCRPSELPISWSAAGAPGPQGPQGIQGPKGERGEMGPAPRITTEPAGSNCANGGLRVSDAEGDHFVCNGAPGANSIDLLYRKAEGIISVHQGEAYTTLLSLDLPAGTFLVSAQAEVIGVHLSGSCRLRDSSSQQDVSQSFRGEANQVLIAPIRLTLPVTMAAPGQAILECRGTQQSQETYPAKPQSIWAIPIGTMTVQQ